MKKRIVMKDDNSLMRRVRAAEQTAALMRLVVIESVALVVVSVFALVMILTSTSTIDSEAALGQTAGQLTPAGALDVHFNDAADTLLVRMKTVYGWEHVGHVVWEND